MVTTKARAALAAKFDKRGEAASFCRTTGLDRSILSRIIGGKREPTWEQARLFESLLGIPDDWWHLDEDGNVIEPTVRKRAA